MPWNSQRPKGDNTTHWDLPFSAPFAISNFPIGVSAPIENVVIGKTVLITYYTYGNDWTKDGVVLLLVDTSSSS